MRKYIIAANWKMNVSLREAANYVETFKVELGDLTEVETVLIPAFTALSKVSELLTSGMPNVKLGAQNMYFEKSGAYTGEISAEMLRELYVKYVVLGHSERRAIFNESDALINKKVHAALEASMRPILCVGETLEEREAGKVESVLTTQVDGSLANLTDKQLLETVIAYEPVWAIGTGKTASPEQAQEVHAFLRGLIAKKWDKVTADKVRIQYGGSVKPGNAVELMKQPDIDGALVGGAALDPRDFAKIIKAAAGLNA